MNILAVDDTETNRKLLHATLEAEGHHVLEAANGLEALAVYQSHAGKISAVITDVMMPVMGGEALVRELRKTHPEVKVICITGLELTARLTGIAQLEASAFLTKPYSTEKLLNTLREVLATG